MIGANIEIYTKDWCPYCAAAKDLLRARKAGYVEYDVTSDTEKEDEMRLRSRRHTVPQIFIDGAHVGGFDDLTLLDASGELDARLDPAANTE